MISSNLDSLSESEKALRTRVLDVDTYVWRLRRLHGLFKFTSIELVKLIPSDTNALENLDTLLDLYLNESELYITELDFQLKEMRDLIIKSQHR